MFPAKTLGEPSLALDGSSVLPFLLFGAALASLVLVTHLCSSEIRPEVSDMMEGTLNEYLILVESVQVDGKE